MIRWGMLLALAACYAAVDRGPVTAAAPAQAATTIQARLALAPGSAPTHTRGKLVVSWLTGEEKAAFDAGKPPITTLRDLWTRAEVIGDVDAAREVPFTAHTGRGRVALFASVDVSRTGILSLFGEGEGTLSGISAVLEVGDAPVPAPTIQVSAHPPRQRREACQGDRLTLEHIEAPAVAGTVGNPTSRRACVRVPADYAGHPERRYPVVYALPGFHSTDAAVIESYELDPSGVILVAVDTSTSTGSTYLVDSPTSGQWDRFFTKVVIPYIDDHYRTLARRQARGITGHSSGGFNAVSYGLRHPDLIGVVAASSPDGLDFTAWLTEGGAVRPWIRDFARVERGMGGAGQMISYAADWSPTGGGYEWLFDASGAVVEAVLHRWLGNTPGAWLGDPARVAAMAPLSGHIYLTVGQKDEFDLLPPTVAFSRALTAAGIVNELVVTPGGHGSTVEHMAAIAKFMTAKLDAARP